MTSPPPQPDPAHGDPGRYEERGRPRPEPEMDLPFPGKTECGCDPRTGAKCDRHARPWWKRILNP